MTTGVNNGINNTVGATIGGITNGLVFYPPTTSKGTLRIAAGNSSGNYTTTITTASQAAARTYTIADPGADTQFLMSQGNQTISGVYTFSGVPALPSTGFSLISGYPDVAVATTNLTFTQVRTLGTAGIQVVAAPGAGLMNIPIMAYLYKAASATAYTATGNLQIFYDSAGTNVASNSTNNSGFLTVTTASYAAVSMKSGAGASSAFTAQSNSAMYIKSSAAITLGDGALSIKVFYATLPDTL